ncbi:unnamed protein product [Rangifer tarandus platyrhynchus]|uniref:Uncharacterized protein n=1 Tax=Rangifer tarandus platyrhynchus TaxID=3082113 RepID=A0AC59YW12_RANTA
MQSPPSTDQEVTCGPGHELLAEEGASASSGERRKVSGHQVGPGSAGLRLASQSLLSRNNDRHP